MPFPLNPSGREGLLQLDPTETLARWCSRFSSYFPSPSHYAIKRPPTQVPKRFYNVTEGTCSNPLWLPINSGFLHIVLLILLLPPYHYHSTPATTLA